MRISNHFRTLTETIFLRVCFCFLGVCFLRSETLDCSNISEKGTVLQIFFWSLQILEHLFLSELSQKIVCSGIFSPVV